MSTPITFVYPFYGQCALNVDHHGREYRVCWSGDWRKPPDLSAFPRVDNATSSSIPHSPGVNELWAASRVLKHGADSHIRVLSNCTDDFPICKVAINDRQRRLVQEEVSILRFLSARSPGIPVAQIHPRLLEDDDGIFGFRMEKLNDVAVEDMATHLDEIKGAVSQLHHAGVIHYDLSPSNIMLNMSGHVTLIDFGRAGYIGDRIPLTKEKGAKPSGESIYDASWDFHSLRKLDGEFGVPTMTVH